MDPVLIKLEVERLAFGRPEDQARAERILQELSPGDVHHLLEWSQASEQAQSWVNGCSSCTAACFGVPAVLLLAAVLASAVFADLKAIWGVTFLMVPLLVAYGATRLIKSRQINVEYEALRRVADPLVCIPILEQYYSGNPLIRPHATDTLRRLLPHLKGSDSAQFTRQARSALNTIVRKPASFAFDTEFIVLCIEALGQVGDASSAAALTGLLREIPHGKRETLIHETAKRVLESIRTQIEAKRQADTLLRASESGDMNSLLHSSQASAESDPEILLRPTEDGRECR